MTQQKSKSFHNQLLGLSLSIFLVVIMLFVAGFSNTNKSVTVVSDNRKITVRTVYDNPLEIIRQSGIEFKKGDSYSLSTDKISNGTVITVKSKTPVNVEVFGRKRIVFSAAKDVRGLMEELGYSPSMYAALPDKNATLRDDMFVKLEPLTRKIELRDKKIPYEVIHRKNPQLEVGKSKVVQKGIDGIGRVTVRESYLHGEKIAEEVLQESITKVAVPEIVEEGARPKAAAGISPYSKVINVEASAYLPSDGGGSGYTATGVPARRGVIAVDPNVIPLGSHVYIPGYGEAIAADTGGFSGRAIDVCVDTYAEAMNWGRRNVDVYILEN